MPTPIWLTPQASLQVFLPARSCRWSARVLALGLPSLQGRRASRQSPDFPGMSVELTDRNPLPNAFAAKVEVYRGEVAKFVQGTHERYQLDRYHGARGWGQSDCYWRVSDHRAAIDGG